VLEFGSTKIQQRTLLMVTAEYETGELTLPTSDIKSKAAHSDAKQSYSTIGHTATMVPVYAFGKGAENFSGVYDNHEIHAKLLMALGKN